MRTSKEYHSRWARHNASPGRVSGADGKVLEEMLHDLERDESMLAAKELTYPVRIFQVCGGGEWVAVDSADMRSDDVMEQLTEDGIKLGVFWAGFGDTPNDAVLDLVSNLWDHASNVEAEAKNP